MPSFDGYSVVGEQPSDCGGVALSQLVAALAAELGAWIGGAAVHAELGRRGRVRQSRGVRRHREATARHDRLLLRWRQEGRGRRRFAEALEVPQLAVVLEEAYPSSSSSSKQAPTTPSARGSSSSEGRRELRDTGSALEVDLATSALEALVVPLLAL
mgnify:CR=1 FL=1